MDEKQIARARAEMARVVALKDEICDKIIKLEKDHADTTARIKELGRDDPRARALRGLRDLEEAELKELRTVRRDYMSELKTMLKMFQKDEGPIQRPSGVLLRMPAWRSKVSNKAITIEKPEV